MREIFFNKITRPLVMGILNVTPDSFSDGGSYGDTKEAVSRALQMVSEGADIVDVGGESTRPGYIQISDDEEISRVVPVIRGIREKSDVLISIDTYKREVAKAAFDAGADILNDIWGLKKDNYINKNMGICLMHNREEIRDDEGDIFIKSVSSELLESVDIATDAGVYRDRILLDPGIGFGKSYEQNLYLISHIDELIREVEVSAGYRYPFMMAASRKSVIGLSLDLPVEERDEATIAISVYSAMKGCSAVRVHDVKGNVRALKMLEKLG